MSFIIKECDSTSLDCYLRSLNFSCDSCFIFPCISFKTIDSFRTVVISSLEDTEFIKKIKIKTYRNLEYKYRKHKRFQ